MSFSYPPLSPSIAVTDAARAIAFYVAAFNAKERYRLIDPVSGRIGHAELELHGGLLMLADPYPGHNTPPETLGGTPVTLSLMVPDVDAATAQAAAAGATITRPPANQFYGYRCANLRDPFGHEWTLSCEIEAVSPAEMQARWNAMARPE